MSDSVKNFKFRAYQLDESQVIDEIERCLGRNHVIGAVQVLTSYRCQMRAQDEVDRALEMLKELVQNEIVKS